MNPLGRDRRDVDSARYASAEWASRARGRQDLPVRRRPARATRSSRLACEQQPRNAIQLLFASTIVWHFVYFSAILCGIVGFVVGHRFLDWLGELFARVRAVVRRSGSTLHRTRSTVRRQMGELVNPNDLRPSVWVGHVVLETDRLEASAEFMRKIGMRSISEGADVAILELRGGTHLILTRKNIVVPGAVAFDLMVDDLHHAHALFTSLGLHPSPIEAIPGISHEVFTIQEPAGHVISVFSSHVEGRPV